MDQGGFDDLFTSSSAPAVSNPFADGDNPFADIRSPTSDPWASFYAAQPTSPPPNVPTSPSAPTDSRYASESPTASPTSAFSRATATHVEPPLSPADEEHDTAPIPPPRTSTLSPAFREVYEEPTREEVATPVIHDTPTTFDIPAAVPAFEPSYAPHPVATSPVVMADTHVPSMSTISGLPETSFELPLPVSAFSSAGPFTPTTPLTASTSSSYLTPTERKSTADLMSSLGIADDSPSSTFGGKSRFKPPPTPKRRPQSEKKSDPPKPAVPQPAAEPVKEATPPAAATPPPPPPVKQQSVTPVVPAAPQSPTETTTPTSVVPQAVPAPSEPTIAPSLEVAPTIPPVVVPDISEPSGSQHDMENALATPLPPSETPTPAAVQTPVRVASPPVQSIAEPLSPTTNAWGVSPTPAPANLSVQTSFLSPLDAPYKRPVDRTMSDLTLGGGDDPGWLGFASPVTSPGPAEPWGGSADGEALGDRSIQSVIAPTEGQGDEPAAEPAPAARGTKRHTDPSRPNITVTVGDPQKVGDPIKAHIVYTVHTTTSSPNLFRKQTFSVLRRYSDFLWLYDALCVNNSGIIVPPVPEKHSFGRFEETFVETRRQALNKCIQKIVDHPLLYTDPALKLFLESDSFALDIKHRKTEVAADRAPAGTGLMATIGSTLTGPKFIENDDWFENRKMYLDALESQFRGLIKAIDAVSKQRAEVSTAASELSDALAVLGSSGLSKQLSHTVTMLAEVEGRIKDLQEAQAKDDIMTFLAGIDEYTRLIGSIRVAFMSRERVYVIWQNAESDVRRVRLAHEKAKRQGRLPTDTTGVSLAQLGAAERRVLDTKNEFDSVTKLVKSEIARFELERIEDFKDSLEQFLENMIGRQRDLISAWEQYQNVLLKRMAANPAVNGGAR